MEFDQLKYWLWMTYIKDMWRCKAENILEVFGTPEELYHSHEDILKKSRILSEEDIYNVIVSRNTIDIEVKWSELERKGILFTTCERNDYPKSLLQYKEKPLWLYYKGKLPNADEKMIGMVGARNCSIYGKIMSETISEQVGIYGVSVVSGLARGIDAAAHRGALRGGAKTYAVLGCGVDVCYPRDNIELYMKIQEQGCIMSEYIPGAEPLKWRFPERNRIISMLSDVVAVVEAKKNSGSLITTDYALQYGKEIFAVPGRVGDLLSEGCNELIKSGAGLLTEGADMLFAVGGSVNDDKNNKKNKSKIVLEKENDVVYSCLGLLPQSIETIVKKTGMTAAEVFSNLVQLMVVGLVIEPTKNHYSRVK